MEQDRNDQFRHIQESNPGVFSVPSFDLCGEIQIFVTHTLPTASICTNARFPHVNTSFMLSFIVVISFTKDLTYMIH